MNRAILAALTGFFGCDLTVRGLIGGRFNFTARSVIAPDHTLQLDEVKLSYQCLVGLLQQRIINILHKAYNMSYNEAYIFLDSQAKSNRLGLHLKNKLLPYFDYLN